MEEFDLGWLRLRTPFDDRARAAHLAAGFAAALPRGGLDRPVRILDLGAGSGANFRHLAPVLARPQLWQLADRDEALQAAERAETAAWREAGGHPATWRAGPLHVDLARDLDALDFSAVDAVTCTALLDLVSAAWVDRLAGRLKAAGRPFLATLSVDGQYAFSPSHPSDAAIVGAFARDLCRDKGFGPALGGTSGAVAATRLAEAGFAVQTAPSPWQVGPADAVMLAAMIDALAETAARVDPALAERATGWASDRRSQASGGALSLVVGHVDVLALPIQPRD